MGYPPTTVGARHRLFKYPGGYFRPPKVPAFRDLRPGGRTTAPDRRRYSAAALTTSSSDSSTSAAAGPSGTKLSRLVTREIRPR